MGRNAHKERDARLDADRRAALSDASTAEFIDLFAPVTPLRRREFESKLATLIEAHCVAREFAVIQQGAVVTAICFLSGAGNSTKRGATVKGRFAFTNAKGPTC